MKKAMIRPEEPRFITVDQLSREVGLSPRLIRRLVAEGRIVHIRSGKKVWINRSKALEFFDNPIVKVDQIPSSNIRRVEV